MISASIIHRVLIIITSDVARYKYGPLWVPVHDLFSSMNTIDPTSGLRRGFLIFSTKNISSELEGLIAVPEVVIYQGRDDSFDVLLPVGFSFAVLFVIIMSNKIYSQYYEKKKSGGDVETYEMVNPGQSEEDLSVLSALHNDDQPRIIA